jgi:hypothetical protein
MNAFKRTVSVNREGNIEVTGLDLAEGTIVEVILLVDEIDVDEEKQVEFAREAYKKGDFLTLEQYNAQKINET